MANNPDLTRAKKREWTLPPWQRHLYGTAVILIVTLGISLAIASYAKVFEKVTMVNLETDHTGMQLLLLSDVKIRGIIVGDVRKISTYVATAPDGTQETRARLRLALKPGKTDLIPRGVTALLLPKTLFGERYVALQIPDDLTPDEQRPIRAGDTITEARSSIELSSVLNDLYPVLLSLHPEDLKTTLTALSTALQGRGKQLGDNLAKLDHYLTKLNPQVPKLADDLDKLGQVALLYNEAAPDLLGALDNLATTNRTIATHATDLHNLLLTATQTADDADSFLQKNGDAIIRVAAGSQPALALLDRYSPEYTCLLAAFTLAEPHEEGAFGGVVPGLHITMEIVKDQGKYVQGDQFKYPFGAEVRYPKCLGLPNPVIPWPGAAYEKLPYDGAVGNANPTANRLAYSGPVVGSAYEKKLLGVLSAGPLEENPSSVPDVTRLLLAPLVRGASVTVR